MLNWATLSSCEPYQKNASHFFCLDSAKLHAWRAHVLVWLPAHMLACFHALVFVHSRTCQASVLPYLRARMFSLLTCSSTRVLAFLPDYLFSLCLPIAKIIIWHLKNSFKYICILKGSDTLSQSYSEWS